MNDLTTFAWILLSVPPEGGELQHIIRTADAINHALPTPDELRRSFGWLKNRDLLRREGEHFSLTDAGKTLVSRARTASHGQGMMETWRAVASELERLSSDSAPLEELAIEEIRRAEAAYHKLFWQRYKELRERDA